LWCSVSLLVLDLAVVAKRPHVPLDARGGAVGVVLRHARPGLLRAPAAVGDSETAGAFVAGWITEYSLSVDNLFVFVIIMARFAVPASSAEVLMIGIILSLVLRRGFILLGAAVIERFSWVFYLFGLFLVYTAVGLLRGGGHEADGSTPRTRHPPGPPGASHRAAVRRRPGRHPAPGGGACSRPMVIVFLAIGSTDLLFALDSIPAIFGSRRTRSSSSPRRCSR
jgi:tellurite resistance protein TerC